MPGNKIKLAIVDDHQIVIDGIAGLLSEYEDFSVVFTALNGVKFFEELNKKKRQIDVVILDIKMPQMDGLEVLRRLKMFDSGVKPLILTMYNSDELIYEMIELGALGLVPKTVCMEDLVDAIFSVHNDELYFTDDVSQRVLKKLAKKRKTKTDHSYGELSKREEEIIRLICNEHTMREIGEILFISERTVDAHKTSIFEKTKAKNIAGVVMYAFRTGLVE